jgi:hypothetical protein
MLVGAWLTAQPPLEEVRSNEEKTLVEEAAGGSATENGEKRVNIVQVSGVEDAGLCSFGSRILRLVCREDAGYAPSNPKILRVLYTRGRGSVSALSCKGIHGMSTIVTY